MIIKFTSRNKRLLSLSIKILISFLAVWFIYGRIFANQDMLDVRSYFESVYQSRETKALLGLTLGLMLLNWGVEAAKWRILIKKIEHLSFLSSIRAVFSGITFSIFTPNRIGEYAGRVLVLDKGDRIKGALITMIGSFSQLIVTMVTGGIAFFFFMLYFSPYGDNFYMISLIAFLIGMVLLIGIAAFLNVSILTILLKRIPFLKRYDKYVEVFSYYNSSELGVILLLSLFRYAIFSSQFYFLLIAFKVNISIQDASIFIPMTFLSTTAIPTHFISELFVRESVAMSLIGIVSAKSIGIVSTSFVLWTINLAIPALVGSIFLFGMRIFLPSQPQK